MVAKQLYHHRVRRGWVVGLVGRLLVSMLGLCCILPVPYDGPIYTGYATLTPGRVIVEVQQQLGVDGYYAGPIDGRMGPQTRAGIAAFQADNGLTVTSTIDQPTLQTLGLA